MKRRISQLEDDTSVKKYKSTTLTCAQASFQCENNGRAENLVKRMRFAGKGFTEKMLFFERMGSLDSTFDVNVIPKRNESVQWMIDTHSSLRLGKESFFLAVKLFDHFLASSTPATSNFPLIASLALSFSCHKYDRPKSGVLQEIWAAFERRYTCTLSDLLSAKASMRDSLIVLLQHPAPTTYHFLLRFGLLLGCSNEILQRSFRLAQRCVTDPPSTLDYSSSLDAVSGEINHHYKPLASSALAAAILLLSCRSFGFHVPWGELSKVTTLSAEVLNQAVREVLLIVRGPGGSRALFPTSDVDSGVCTSL